MKKSRREFITGAVVVAGGTMLAAPLANAQKQPAPLPKPVAKRARGYQNSPYMRRYYKLARDI